MIFLQFKRTTYPTAENVQPKILVTKAKLTSLYRNMVFILFHVNFCFIC